MKKQSQKRILMFCAPFFGYDKRLVVALEELGFQVDLYDEKPGDGFFHKACIRYNIGFYRPVIHKYIKRIIEKNREKRYDYLLVVKGEGITVDAIRLLREAYPNAKSILYLWDSIANIPECETRMACYDRVMTFDPQDAERYNIPCLPVPYGKEHAEYRDTGEYEYDVAFIGTAHSVRPRVVNQIRHICEQKGKKCFVYFYCPHIVVYLLNKLTNRDFRWIKLKDVHFKPLSPKKVCEIYGSSRCILDVEHPRQQGTTTRPVEMLPMKKKIITTNPLVRKYPFFHSNNFLIIDRQEPQLDFSFLETPFIPVNEELMALYSPKNFVQKLIGLCD